MTPFLLKYLCDPVDKSDLVLCDEVKDEQGCILSGKLKSKSGKEYLIKDGIPRFVTSDLTDTVDSFGDEWNHFNFVQFKDNWMKHTVKNTFGSIDVFKDKIMVDAGCGSGAQSLWMLEYGAKHVISLDLSHSVDDVVKRNISDYKSSHDIIQCSIDNPPLKSNSISGIVYCHNVIQHTPSVEKTARALFDIVGKGGEFVFNCYNLNDKGLLRWIRVYLIYKPLRFVLSKLPFFLILLYSKLMGMLRLIPVLGIILEKMSFLNCGDVAFQEGDNFFKKCKKVYGATVLNTFDAYGSHSYQHLKKDEEIIDLITYLQKDETKILNVKKYFTRPQPIGCALRIFK